MSYTKLGHKSVAAVVPAAGIGSRMKSDIPKQYLTINDECILSLTINRLLACQYIDHVVVVLSPADNYFQKLSIAQHPQVSTAIGGKERADSVLAGVKSVNTEKYPWVLVHDAARPCVSVADVSHLIEQCWQTQQGGILASPVRDTMKRGSDAKIINTESRENLWHALTPQMFLTQELKIALVQAMREGVLITDEASAMEKANIPIQLIPSSALNIKVTQPEDLKMAELIILSQQEQS